MIKLENLSLMNILPPNLLTDNNVQQAVKALDGELQLTSGQIKQCLLIARLDELDEAVVDSLAWQYHVDFYQPLGLVKKSKRELVRKSIETHRRKGTPYAVEQVVSAAFNKALVQEWFDYDGEPFMFRITTSGFKDQNSTASHLIKAINSVKNTRSHLDSITLDINPDMDLAESQLSVKVGLIETKIGTKRIPLPKVPDAEQKIYAGMARLKVGRKICSSAVPPNAQSGIHAGVIRKRTGIITIGGIK